MRKTAPLLIVEDEAIVAVDVERMLRRQGYNPVGTASTGADAIVQARELKAEVILMDVRLRGPMNGVEAARKIKSERDVIVLYVTAFTESALALLPPNAQCLAKPFSPTQLFTALDHVMSDNASSAN